MDSEDGGTTVLRNVGNYLPVDMVWHPWRPESSITKKWTPNLVNHRWSGEKVKSWKNRAV